MTRGQDGYSVPSLSDVARGAWQVRGGVQAGPGWEVLPDAV